MIHPPAYLHSRQMRVLHLIRIFFTNFLHVFFQRRRRSFSGRNRYMAVTVIPFSFRKFFRNLVLQKPEHSHSVFQLDIAIVIFLLRDRLSRQQIPFITSMDKVKSPLFIQLFLPFVNRGKNFFCILPGKRFQRLQSVAVLRKSDRDNRNWYQKIYKS